MNMLQNCQLVDIHAHFIFNVDDGASDSKEALGLLNQARELGIKHLLATPHITDLTNDQISRIIMAHFEQLQEEVERQGMGIRLYLASELFFSGKIYEWLQYPWATFNNNRKYLLFELPLLNLPDKVDDFIFQCRLEGLVPILAHPERYGYLAEDPNKLIKWFHQGCQFQMNAGSILGQFGNTVRETARRYLQADMFQFVASDAHNVNARSYEVMPKALQEVIQITGESRAISIFRDNPKRAIEGRTIERLPLQENGLQKRWFDPLAQLWKRFRSKRRKN